jgi:glycosyltransferase involved in cell wall biosynthesis
MPCHNAGRYISQAIDSVLGQTWRDLELVIVDDGSTDNSCQIVEAIADPRIILLRQPCAGAAAARNRALASSSGKFVIFMDADDLLGPSHIEGLRSVVAGMSDFVAMSPWDRFYADPGEATFPAREGYLNSDGPAWLALDWRGGGGMTQPGMFLVPRSLIEKVGGWDERLTLMDDFEFYARIIARSAGLKFASGARLYYRSGIGCSLSGRRGRRAVESAFLSITLGSRHLLQAEDSSRAREACAAIFQNFEYTYFPHHTDLRRLARQRVADLGGSDLKPVGPPGFHRLARLIGWRGARHMQHLAEWLRLNGASRRSPSRSAGEEIRA